MRRAKVDLHNTRAAPLGKHLDPTKLNFRADWDVSRPVAVPVPGARGVLAADRLAGAVMCGCGP
jgi:hypothetical protein